MPGFYSHLSRSHSLLHASSWEGWSYPTPSLVSLVLWSLIWDDQSSSWCLANRQTQQIHLQSPPDKRSRCTGLKDKSYPGASWCWPVRADPCQGSWTCVFVGLSGPLWGRDGLKGSVLKPEVMPMVESLVEFWEESELIDLGWNS